MKHFDTVGSFLRPAKLKQARELELPSLTEFEDEAIDDLIKKQQEAGLYYITDGEFRRSYWHLDFMWGFKGVSSNHDIQNIVINGVDTRLGNVIVEGKLSGFNHPFVKHYEYLVNKLRLEEGHEVKLTIPSPAQFFQTILYSPYQANFEAVYPTQGSQIRGVAKAYLDFIMDLYDLGARVIQFDDCSWGTLVGLPGDTSDMQELFLAANNAVLDRMPKDMKKFMHICRGNYKSQHFSAGPYDTVAEAIFGMQNIDTYYLEYDDIRSGGFEPLKHLTPNKSVVLGLISTKTPILEDKQTIINRIKEATQYVPLERLGLSPQCGFASTEEGNALTEEEQWAKVQLVREIAEEVWG